MQRPWQAISQAQTPTMDGIPHGREEELSRVSASSVVTRTTVKVPVRYILESTVCVQYTEYVCTFYYCTRLRKLRFGACESQFAQRPVKSTTYGPSVLTSENCWATHSLTHSLTHYSLHRTLHGISWKLRSSCAMCTPPQDIMWPHNLACRAA